MNPVHWLSYGGGVNSTALAVLLCEGRLPQYTPWRIVFADTRNEKDETYDYIARVFVSYLRSHGSVMEVCGDREGVLERWERLGVVGHRRMRTCSAEAKIKPIHRHIRGHTRKNETAVQLIGIDAGESHRASEARDGELSRAYPLIELDMDRDACETVIKEAGLCVPPKSGCWCCPFARVGEILDLAERHPDRLERIRRLENKSIAQHPVDEGKVRALWGEKPAEYWMTRAAADALQGDLFDNTSGLPCSCWDGG